MEIAGNFLSATILAWDRVLNPALERMGQGVAAMMPGTEVCGDLALVRCVWERGGMILNHNLGVTWP